MATNKEQVIVEIEVDNKDAVKSIDKQDKATKKLTKSTDEQAEAAEDVAKTTENMTGALDSLLGQMGLSSGGIKQMVTGLKALKVSFAATGIGLLIVALGSLLAYFNSTSEGQEKLKVITASLGAVMSVLVDTLAGLGEVLFKTFSEPQKAMQSFADSFKKLIQDKIDAFFDTIGLLASSIKKLFAGDFKGALTDAKDGVIKLNEEFNPTVILIKAVASAGKEVVEVFKEANEEAKKAGDIQKEANKLKRDQIAFITKEAQLEVAISKEKLKTITFENQSAQDRLDGANEAIRLTKELQASRRNLLTEEITQLEETQKLRNLTLEDEQELQELKKEGILIDKEQADLMAELTGARKGVLDSIQAEKDAKQKILEDEKLKISERNDAAKNGLEEARLQVREDQALELEDQVLQNESLLQIEKERYENELALKDFTDDEKLLLEFEYQTKIDQIKKDGAARQIEIDKAVSDAKKESNEVALKTAASEGAELLGVGKEFALAEALVNANVGISAAVRKGFPAAIPDLLLQGVTIAKAVSGIKKAENGALIGGKRHSQGGTLIEAEQGEIIINRNSSSMFRDILSDINVAGGGIPFAQRGMAVAQASGRSLAANLGSEISEGINNSPSPVLVTEDLLSVVNRVSVTEDIATL